MLDCLVIGAGHCGLTCAALLKQAGVRYRLLDGARRIGDVWRQRPVNLRLFTARRFCQLGDLPMAGDQYGYPSGAEFADYLELYAGHCGLGPELGLRVTDLRHDGMAFVATLSDGALLRCATVINATGSNQIADRPDCAWQLSPSVLQLTGASYRDPQSVAGRRVVLVAGDGASGRQIAQELAATHEVLLATGRRRKLASSTLFGRDLFWWLTRLGIIYARRGSFVAWLLRKRDPIPVKPLADTKLRAAGVTVKPRLLATHGSVADFADGSQARIDCAIWCVGYVEDASWLALPRLHGDGKHLSHDAGKTPYPGFYLVGRKWLTCRASELVLGASRDCALVVGYVRAHLAARTPVSIH